ncbi:hypothetical protein FIV42_06010 [Persicimonas caeni]|uniref:Outer membrane protein beta-barrel domain-containing protein n=1 Tax=Persicimonas caeni TaxID=2292766 RepID=A0A4Y6PPP2_PERCE|nr:hypothetical protein [Persicimonas caeni]QDG50302.1 hypothetical protein FIV42_06010 [Persicimonas caeni]QED31523.1 hypothetical protein FRD00_06005 [Persicimonas caeni]
MPRRTIIRYVVLSAVSAALVLCAPPVRADEGYFAAGETGVSYLGEWASGSLTPGTAAVGVRAGYRWESWDVFGVADQVFWFDPELGGAADPILNIGAGVGLRHIGGHVRSSVTLGTSTLLFDTRLTQAGKVGAFIEVQPAGFRLPVADRWNLEFHPLGFVLSSPVLTEIPLFNASYRTSLAVEATF